MLFLGNPQSICQSFAHQSFVDGPFVEVNPRQTFALYEQIVTF